ncbi:hypothetical protein C8A03DRAFT_37478 [Achaetomium macrosporum]|uniref:Uncharacterized protein n=1 Tax=Achaetomium macrosporum TaxID=79813 RepID=A0AAN7C3M5_9PEZI|nr:hypothetical protein C8A03DRAFT_37478 [Achaetomium macrosporum]
MTVLVMVAPMRVIPSTALRARLVDGEEGTGSTDPVLGRAVALPALGDDNDGVNNDDNDNDDDNDNSNSKKKNMNKNKNKNNKDMKNNNLDDKNTTNKNMDNNNLDNKNTDNDDENELKQAKREDHDETIRGKASRQQTANSSRAKYLTAASKYQSFPWLSDIQKCPKYQEKAEYLVARYCPSCGADQVGVR